MYKDIYIKIRDLLEAVADIKEVNIFNDGNFSRYPAINITSISKTRERTAPCMIDENGNISLVVYQEINVDNTGAERGDYIILNLIDQIDDVFDNNSTLDGLLDDITLDNASMGYMNRELNFRTWNINLKYKALKQLSNN